MDKVACIIVTYNASRWIYNCLKSIDEKNITLDIIVIDNNSNDNTITIIKENFPLVRILAQSENLGFAAANNLGFKIAEENRAKYIYLLNQDTVSCPDSIYQLVRFSSNFDSKLGFVSPIHLNDSGKKLDYAFETYINSYTCRSLISDYLTNNTKKYYQIDFVNAAAWLIKVETIRNLGGLFSSAFYHYGEDVNFVQRLSYHGYKNYILTDVFVKHCRAERQGKINSAFIQKEAIIRAKTELYNINKSLCSSIFEVFKIAIKNLLRRHYINSLILLLMPIKDLQKIREIRKSYKTSKIL